MNYLAHLYLSGDSEGVMMGNFIGDYVKGKQYLKYSENVQKGILLHRYIDSYTDKHALVKQCAERFREKYGRYSGIVVDVVFDHFLARYWNEYSFVTLRQFSKYAHAVLLSNFIHLPTRVKGFLPFLIQHKRLESYAHLNGIQQSLEIMGYRTTLPNESDYAIQVLTEDYLLIKGEFEDFFPGLIAYVESEFGIEINRPAKHGPWFDRNVI